MKIWESIKRIYKIVVRWSVQFCKYMHAYVYLHVMHSELLRQNAWLITEKKTEARDNGYCFFEYLRTFHPEINAYYAISADSPDKHKVDKLGNVILYDSLKHYALCLAADFCVSSQTIGAHPAVMIPRFYHILAPLRNKKQRVIFIQHGVTKDLISRPDWYYASHMIDLFAVSAAREREFLESNYGYPPGYVKELGMCRFDKLVLPKLTKDKSILIMPTWRKWLHHSGGTEVTPEEKRAFLKSDFYLTYMHLLCNPEFSALLKRYGYTVVFYPHYALQCYIDDFMTASSEQIVIADRERFDVQQLLISSSALITDYSSVFFDFAYLKKPEIFYQFDEKQFRNSHYNQGYFSYAEDAFGPICYNEADLLGQLDKILKGGCIPEQRYTERVDSFFTYKDNHNCERTYDAIQKLTDVIR